MNALYSILVIVLAIILLALVAVRNFKRLRMGCFFDLEARDQGSEIKGQKSAIPNPQSPILNRISEIGNV